MAMGLTPSYTGMQYPAAYQNGSYSYNAAPSQPYNPPVNTSYAAPQQQTAVDVMQWVDGEIGAKAFQIPSGWPANKPIPLWDTNDPIIYLKSINQLGMPNPLQKVHYTMEEVQQPVLMTGQSGSAIPANTDYVTKDDIRTMKDELIAFITSHGSTPRTDGRSQTNGNRNGGGDK